MRNFWVILLTLGLPRLLLAGADGSRSDLDFFESRVRPVLAQHCFKCHSASADAAKGGLQLDSREAMLKGGDSGPAMVPGKPEKSLLIKAVRHDPAVDLEMPPKSKLTDSAVADLGSWIQRGASWPAESRPEQIANDRRSQAIEAARKEHWAFQPLKTPPVPAVADSKWGKTPIDAFILAKLEQNRLNPSSPADRRTLLRRVYLDLIGLPPTPAQQQAFLDDNSPAALEKVVDDLLSRPQYGERWGRHWLDVARYAESQGYERDEPKPSAWRYRDYVINAFNRDLPYDRFVTDQIAGDEVQNPTAETQIATSFLRIGPFDTIAADGKLARYDQLDDIVGTVSAAFLGQTLRCARCHDHKFEPLTQTDYYSLLAAFEPLTAKAKDDVQVGSEAELAAHKASQAAVDAKVAELQPALDELRRAIVEPLTAEPSNKTAEPSNKKGALSEHALSVLRKPAAERTKQDLDYLAKNAKRFDEELAKNATPQQKQAYDKLNRAIAELEAKRPQGIFAYIFQETPGKLPKTRLFIRGDCNKPGDEVGVATPAVLGGDRCQTPVTTAQRTSGRRLWLAQWMTDGPAKPLAARVMVNRIWQYHFGVGLVASSNDFGVRCDPPSHPELLEWLADDFVRGGWTIKRLHKAIILSSVYQTSSAHQVETADPEGRLLAYWHTRRLESEIIRDSMLAVSGKLNLQTFGPSVFPPLAQRIVGNSASNDWPTSNDRDSARRSVYICVKRNILVPELEVLGIADSASSAERRPVATTALQSLMLLNSKFATDQAASFAERVRAEAGADLRAQVVRAFELSLCRLPREQEVVDCLAYLSSETKQPTNAGQRGEASSRALASLCLVLMNTSEFIYMN